MTTIRLDKSYEDQILELIEASQNRFVGGIQDGRVVLGGSAGSAGGVGDPPAGFWGQLRQANVAYDTTEAAYTGGSDSLVDNLAHIRDGDALAADSIHDWHIDWGSGGSQVDAFDVPFTSTSGSISSTNVGDALEEVYAEGGGGGLGIHDHHNAAAGGSALNPATISPQTFIVGPSPCPYTNLESACQAVNAMPPSAGSPCTILLMGGVTIESNDIDLPDYTAIIGMDESTTIDMGANQLYMGTTNSTMSNLIIHSHCTGAKDCALYIYNAANARLWNVLANIKPDNGAKNYGFQFGGASTAEVYHCRVMVDGAGADVRAFYTSGTSTVKMEDCDGTDTDNDYGLYVGNTLTTTKRCSFYGQTDDVYVVAAKTWEHLGCHYDSGNVTILGTETVLPQSKVNLDGRANALILDADGDTTISSPTDDRVDFGVGGSYIVQLVPTALKSQGSVFPNLGTTTAAEKWGHIYLASTRDFYPDGESRGQFTRVINRSGISTYTDHFRSGVIPTGFTWRGAPFGGVPPSVYYSFGGTYMVTITAAATRYFLADDIANNAASWQNKGITARVSPSSGAPVGVRFDDGTDNNYAELYGEPIPGQVGTWRISFEQRAGGGAPVITSSNITYPLGEFLVIYLSCKWTGAQYYNRADIIGEHGTAIYLTSTAFLAWMPAAGRVGMICDNADMAFWDWFYSDFGLA